jgi:CheY-like chemotaxis protein
VVVNLAVNARDAMPHGGILTIQTQNVELDENYARTHVNIKPGKYVALVVSDNGAGMDAQTRAHLFEPFFTTKERGKGTGLGLTTVFGIVKQSGGGVDVYSEPGHGTSVNVYLPRSDRPATGETKSPAAESSRGSETILLVEDEEPVRNLVRDTLQREGYTVLDAPNAADARRMGRTYKGPIHLLIADVVMPKEGGRDLAHSLAPQRPSMKVLFMSGYTDLAVVSSGLLNSEAAFIQKPFTPAALSAKVREILEENGHNSKRAGG